MPKHLNSLLQAAAAALVAAAAILSFGAAAAAASEYTVQSVTPWMENAPRWLERQPGPRVLQLALIRKRTVQRLQRQP